MKIDIITIFPEFFEEFLKTSIVGRAVELKQVKIKTHQLRDYSHNKHRNIDDTPYGGGAGMLITFPPLYDAVKKLKKKDSKVILLSPQGKLFNQEEAKIMSLEKHIILICGHYEGVDARILEFVDYELSIGDYVLTGGEIPVMVVIDAITRLLPNVIKHESFETDSLQNGLLKYPQYTKPEEYKGYKVPSVLLSGHHKNIEDYRKYEQIKQTYLKRKDLLDKANLSKSDLDLLEKVKNELDS